MIDLTIGKAGELSLPREIRSRYGLAPDTPVRVFETKGGILIIPLTDAPMSADLQLELAAWQDLSAESWGNFLMGRNTD